MRKGRSCAWLKKLKPNPHIGTGIPELVWVGICQYSKSGTSPYWFGVHSNLGTDIYGNWSQVRCPWLITLFITFWTSYIRLLLTLLTVDLSIGHCILQGTSIEFRQREIHMQLVICSNKSQFVAKGLMLIDDFLLHNPDLSDDVFCNSQKQLQHFTTHLEKKLDLAKLAIDVIQDWQVLANLFILWRSP